MQLAGYEVRQGKHLSFRAPEQKNFTYMKSLGSYYSEENVRANQRITQINSELSTQKIIQKHCDSYRLCRKVIENAKSAPNPTAYRSRHQAEYQLHDSLKKELQDFGITKIPSSEKIQKRIDNLVSEKTSTIREKQELRKKQLTLDIIQQNFSALLNTQNTALSHPLPEETL